MKPIGWPRYMIAKRLRSGAVAYYWNCRKSDLAAGFTLHREALGCDYGPAQARAVYLNAHLDDWRAGRGTVRSLDIGDRFGSVDWWLETYFRSAAFERLSDRTKPSYRDQLRRLAAISTKSGKRLGDLPASSITAAAVDKIYERLRGGPEGTKLRSANLTIDIAKKAWTVVQRTHPQQFVASNPFVGLTRFRKTTPIRPATRTEAVALSEAIKAHGHPHLALVPLICFEWLQRPENVLAGHLSWTDYRPAERPHHVRIVHHKTGAVVWHPLEDDGDLFYPDLEARLRDLPRLAVALVVGPGHRGAAKPYSFSYAKSIVRDARQAAGLPDHLTLTACRHGGMTELGDAELTEQGVMSLSGHRSPQAARGYIKKTATQRLAATRRRRAWVLETDQQTNSPHSEPLNDETKKVG